MGIDDIQQEEVLIDFDNRKVISSSGVTVDGQTYYILEQLPNSLYNVEHKENRQLLKFNIDYECIANNKFRVTIKEMNEDTKIKKWQVKYRKINEDYWNTTESLSFILDEEGDYIFKIINDNLESNEVKKTIAMMETDYTKDQLALHYDAINNIGEGDDNHSSETANWKDLSGNGNDATITSTGAINWDKDCLTTNKIETITTPWKFEGSYTISLVFTPLEFYNYNTIWDNMKSANDNECWIDSNKQLKLRSHYNSQGNVYTKMQSEKIQLTATVDKEEDKCSMYINGKLINTITGGINLNSGQLTFNGSTNTKGKNEYYSIRVYNKALSEEEIKQNFEIDNRRFEIDKHEPIIVVNGLALHYDAINNIGEGDDNHSFETANWKDLSESGNDATITSTDAINWDKDCLITNKIETIITPWKFESSYTISLVFTPLEFYDYNTIWDNMKCVDDNECFIYSNKQLKLRSHYNSQGIVYNNMQTKKTQLTATVNKEENKSSLYINGELISTITGGINLNSGQLTFNGSSNTKGKNKYYNMKVYDYALDEYEIKQNYKRDETRFGIE